MVMLQDATDRVRYSNNAQTGPEQVVPATRRITACGLGLLRGAGALDFCEGARGLIHG